MNNGTLFEVPLNCQFTFEHCITEETVCSQSKLADVVSIHLLYRNALDIHNKHTASHLHVAECVA